MSGGRCRQSAADEAVRHSLTVSGERAEWRAGGGIVNSAHASVALLRSSGNAVSSSRSHPSGVLMGTANVTSLLILPFRL